MREFESSQEVVDHAALACARKLTKWFGSEEEAIAALEGDPDGMVHIALTDFIKDQRHMTLMTHMNPGAVSRIILEQLQLETSAVIGD